MSSSHTWSDIKNTIKEELDIRDLLTTMFDEGTIDPLALTNPQLHKSKVDIGIDNTATKRNAIICPFHNTLNDNSTSIYVENNSFICRSGNCRLHKKSLNVIDLYMILRFNVNPDHLATEETSDEFKEAVRELAEMINISFDFSQRKLSPEEFKKLKTLEIREKMFDLYHEALKTHKFGYKAIKYMEETRGFKYGTVPFRELVERFQLGFSPEFFGTTWLLDQLVKEYTVQELLDADVVFNYQKKDKTTKKTDWTT